ncbi:YbdD/YjiX family protein [Streptomyces polyrhachis]|uniref:YbdD/YjiX family protein n=1 Tax=Streptomyces polyrhachis TaxID=1282885 RepID=A0ABW2GQ98_9ACTN
MTARAVLTASAASAVLAEVRRSGRGVWRYLRELTGETAYERYVEHTRGHDPDAEVMDRRTFERCRMDAREADPKGGFRCC